MADRLHWTGHIMSSGAAMKKIATFGEIMLRLSPPGTEKLFQSPGLSARFGGGEANVAVSLALFGHPVRYVSVIPANELGDAAVAELRKWGVETAFIRRQGKRLGLYFAETGAAQRPSKVIYDREHSAIAEAQKGDIDWDEALSGIEWLHTTGITPALSASAAELTLEAVRTAKDKKIRVSIDFNYRGKLWKYGRSAPEVMREIVRWANIGIGNEEDCQKSLGVGAALDVDGGALDPAVYEKLTADVLNQFPNLSKVAITLRESRGADHNFWSAVLRNRQTFIVGPKYEIADIVDRIGSGDAFAAGLIHGFELFPGDAQALDFAIAASCLKHSVPGDFNLVSEKDILALMKGKKSGRIER
jgi:2-dehydro-3-deoxygluconokinase